jgi:hypothetical protein
MAAGCQSKSNDSLLLILLLLLLPLGPQPFRLIVRARLSAARCPLRLRQRERHPAGKGGTAGEIWPMNLAFKWRLPRHLKICDMGPTALLPLQGFFRHEKSDGFFFIFCSYLVLHCSDIGLSVVVCIVSYCMLWIFPAGKIGFDRARTRELGYQRPAC